MAATPQRSERLFRVRQPDLNAVRVLTALVVVATFGLTGGPLGIVGGLLLAGASFVFAAPVTVALGHVLLLGILPDPTLVQLVAVEFGFVLILAVPAIDLASPRVVAGTTTLCVAILGGILGIMIGTVDDLWVVCGVLVLLVATAAYGLYRYELVQRGLVGNEEDEL